MPSHRLSAMLEEVGLVSREEHDALEDAKDCRRITRRMAAQKRYGTYHGASVVDQKLFLSDPDPTFQGIPDPDPISDPA